MRAPLRIGLVGCGRLAQVGYVPACALTRSVVLSSVADPHPRRCEATAPDVPAFASVRELVAAGAADAVVVATPVASHVEVAADAARAGVPALVEKPPAPSAVEAERLTELDPQPYLGFNRRHDDALRALRERVPPTGELDLRLAFDRRGTWQSYGGGDPLLLDNGPHLFDLVRWLARAEIERVRATERPHGATAEAELAGGRGTAHVVVRTNRPFVESVEVRANGVVVGRHRTGGIVAGIAARLGRASESPLVPSLARQLDAFAEAVRGETRDALATPADGVRVMAVVDAARASAAAGGGWETVNEPRLLRSRSFSSTH